MFVYFLFRMDYVGVILLITTSYIPWLQFAFYCDNIIKLFYMTLVGVLAAGCISVVVQDKFREPCYRWLRLGMLIAAFDLIIIITIYFENVHFFHATLGLDVCPCEVRACKRTFKQ